MNDVGDLYYSATIGALFEWNGSHWNTIHISNYLPDVDELIIALNNVKWWKNEL